ncbi:MAG: deoxyribodipyrimidine photolyase [Actinobacteria bacterium]|nr:deoxyribodipyrimidine photolyase [Actinomycetota bacterium]
MKKTVLLLPDQLNAERGALAKFGPKDADILIVDSDRFLISRPWHRQRIFLFYSALAHFVVELGDLGYKVTEIKASTMADGIAQYRSSNTETQIYATEPNSISQQFALEQYGVELIPSDFFLTSRAEFHQWAQSQNALKMENFYRQQRIRLNILMDGREPTGGKWNFDHDNRLPPPKGKGDYPKPRTYDFDDIDKRVWSNLNQRDLELWGDDPDGTWATTRTGARERLLDFIEFGLADFGAYEDAMPINSWSVYHSLLTPYLNIGLLTPQEVIAAAITKYQQSKIPLASIEGFIRQIIGWREYVNGTYWYFGAGYEKQNQLEAKRKLLPLFWDESKTQMNCVGSVVRDVKSRGYAHHIPRLMVLSNLALLAGVEPEEFLAWMTNTFVDAFDWVMVPNVIGMGLHADGGKMMTKPYAAGGSYISKMGQFCGSCKYDPKLRVGDNACPFTTLYWDFLDRHREKFERNHRMRQQFFGLDRLSDLDKLRLRAQEVLTGLESGEI